MKKIRWSDLERELLLEHVEKERAKHPTMSTLDLVRMAQKIALPSDRRRDLTGIQQVGWVQHHLDHMVKNYVPISERPIFIEELPQVTPKPDLMTQLVGLLSDAMVQVIAEAIIATREKLDLPTVVIPVIPAKMVKDNISDAKIKKIAIYGLFSNQVSMIRAKFRGCFEFRILKDVSNDKLDSAAQWADHFIIMTKFVSHDYNFLKKYGNIIYNNGASSSLSTMLEDMYFA